MKIYDIQGDKVIFTPEFLAVPKFNAIWRRDRTKAKSRAIRELSYIVFLCDNTIHNPYGGYSETAREDILKEDFMGKVEWEPDEVVKEAVSKLRKLLETSSSRLVASAMIAADKLNDYYRNVDLNALDSNGKPLFSAKELQASIKDLSGTIKSLYGLKEQLRKEQLDSNIARGGFDIGDFELPSTDIDYGEE